jgi:hypothetical protein
MRNTVDIWMLITGLLAAVATAVYLPIFRMAAAAEA